MLQRVRLLRELGIMQPESKRVTIAPQPEPRRVMLWAPPRTLSTAVERALIENPAVQVIHEPFGVPHYWSGEAASTREAGERVATSYCDVAHLLWQAPLAPGKTYLFSKNLAYYFAPHCLPHMPQMLGGKAGDYSQVVHSFIIRHPAKAIASLYHKSCVDNEKTGYTHFDPAEAGFAAMGQLLDHLDQQPSAPPCVIIDADDLLDDPEGTMRAYCEAVGLPFAPSMLSWAPGPVKELESPWTGWTDDVINSCGITRKAKTSLLPPVHTLPHEVQQTIAEALPVYERMHARRLVVHPAAPAVPTPTAPRAKKHKPIGASLSVDDWRTFALHSAHRWKPAHQQEAPRPSECLVSLSKPIRAVLSADILLSPQALTAYATSPHALAPAVAAA